MFSPYSESVCDCECSVSRNWENFSVCDEQKDRENEKSQYIDNKVLRIMQKMGYKNGSGLGKNEQGVTKAIDVTCHMGKRGFGSENENVKTPLENWDFTKECRKPEVDTTFRSAVIEPFRDFCPTLYIVSQYTIGLQKVILWKECMKKIPNIVAAENIGHEIHVKETITWLESQEPSNAENIQFSLENITTWVKEGVPCHQIENEINFCDKNILHEVIKAKDIFDELNMFELCQARTKANPFETIRSVFFMNRAALKMANIDAATEFMFTNIDQNDYHKFHKGPYYFADVCAGPGGFTEYILWRKKWFFKGFGLTLKDENDFKLRESSCASSVTFQALYGKLNDGNICNPENIEDFKEKILFSTDGQGVHFVTADGGFSVEGNENIQEILSKKIYICQCLVALEIVRTHGHFVTKLFDTFTPFSVGLLYLIYKCFEKVSIFKPNSSRPANSERYFICSNLRESSIIENIKKYMRTIVRKLWMIKDSSDIDVLEIVPIQIIKGDNKFYSYIVENNNSLGKRQIMGLKKLAVFCQNPNLIEIRQEELRKKCLEYWKIPNMRIPQPQLTLEELLNLVINKPEILVIQPREINSSENFNLTFSDVDDWHYCPMYSSQKSNNCNFFAGIGSAKVYRLQGSKWVKVKNLHLVSGTLLYGELLKERNTLQTSKTDSFKYSLHVIDALRLGDKNLVDMRFTERINLIQIYCKSVNKELATNSVRIRPKVIKKLSSILSQPLVMKEAVKGSYVSSLPVIGYKTLSELFDVNSLLLLKTNNSQSFYSTYVLRIQIFINSARDQNQDELFSWENLISQLKERHR